MLFLSLRAPSVPSDRVHKKSFIARSKAELAKSPQCPFLFNVVLVYPCIKDLGDCTDLFRDTVPLKDKRTIKRVAN